MKVVFIYTKLLIRGKKENKNQNFKRMRRQATNLALKIFTKMYLIKNHNPKYKGILRFNNKQTEQPN